MNIDLHRYFSFPQPRVDTRKGVEGIREGRKKQQIVNKKKKETSQGLRGLSLVRADFLVLSLVVGFQRYWKRLNINHWKDHSICCWQ